MSTKKEKAESKPNAKPKAKEWNVVWKDPNELTPYEKNARKNDATVPYLVNSIKRFGFRVPLVIDAKGVVVCGHTRLKAALNMGINKVPCVVADDLTNAEIKAFRLADNKIAEMSGWDFEKLDEELDELKIDFDEDMADFGFDAGGEEDEEDDDKKVKSCFEVIVECSNESEMEEVFNRLQEEGLKCRVSTL